MTYDLDIDDAKDKIDKIFQQLNLGASLSYKKKEKGKVYEIACLAAILEKYKSLGHFITLSGSTLVLKQGGGKIDQNKAYFSVFDSEKKSVGQIYTNIWFETIGSQIRKQHLGQGNPCRSDHHELDIVFVHHETINYPKPDQIHWGVECKAVKDFNKKIIKEVLGVRSELQTLPNTAPNPHYFLFYVDPNGSNYKECPLVHGITFFNYRP